MNILLLKKPFLQKLIVKQTNKYILRGTVISEIQTYIGTYGHLLRSNSVGT